MKYKLNDNESILVERSGVTTDLLDGKQDALTAGEGIALSGNTLNTIGIPFGICDSTSTSTSFTVTVPGIDRLEDGVCCMVKNGVVTSASGFVLDVNGLGGKPVYSNMSAASRDTTIFNSGYTMIFVYDSTRVEGGCWICYRGYDANTNTIGYQLRGNTHSLPASDAFVRYRLLFTSADGTKFVPSTTGTSTGATASRNVNQTPIDPFGEIVYYGSTTAITANSRPSVTVLWTQYDITLGYSFNKTGAALTLTPWEPLYIKCTPQSDGSAIMDSTTPYVQALPGSNDGKIYIFLGVAISATKIELLNNHPVYYHDGTGIRLWTGKAIPTNISQLNNDAGYITATPRVAVSGPTATQAMSANTLYVFGTTGTPMTSLTITFTAGNANIANSYHGIVHCGNNMAFNKPNNLIMGENRELPTFSAGDIFEFNVMENILYFSYTEAT